MDEVTFKLNNGLVHWMREHSKTCKSPAFDGAHYIFEFIPTGIVEAQTIKCMCCKAEKTAYVD